MNKETVEKASLLEITDSPCLLSSNGKEITIPEALRWAFRKGGDFVLDHLWQEDTDDESLLPEIGKEVIVLKETIDGYEVCFAWRSDRKGIFDKELGNIPIVTFGKGNWNIPNVRYFLNVEFPQETLCWNDMSEEDKADFFQHDPFKIIDKEE